MPQSLWVLGVTALVVVALWYFFNRTLHGKAMLATSFNRVAAELVGINTGWVLFMSFAMSAALGALGGILVTPITLTSYDVGIMLGLKGFVAAVVGGLGNGLGAVRRRPAGRRARGDGRGLHLVGLQGCDALRADPAHSVLHAARPVRRQDRRIGSEHMTKNAYLGLYIVAAILLVLPLRAAQQLLLDLVDPHGDQRGDRARA